jgi:hypothetical protein
MRIVFYKGAIDVPEGCCYHFAVVFIMENDCVYSLRKTT